jgi:hypothetical protein
VNALGKPIIVKRFTTDHQSESPKRKRTKGDYLGLLRVCLGKGVFFGFVAFAASIFFLTTMSGNGAA